MIVKELLMRSPDGLGGIGKHLNSGPNSPDTSVISTVKVDPVQPYAQEWVVFSAGIRNSPDGKGPKVSGIKSIHTNHLGLPSIHPIDIVGIYFKDISNVPLLTPEEEVALAKRIERGNKAKERLSKGRIRSKNTKKELQASVSDGNEARNHLVSANTRFVVNRAKGFRGRGVPFLDLIQYGNEGLIKAAEKFDYRRGTRFLSFAGWWVKLEMQRATENHGKTIRVPVNLNSMIYKFRKTSNNLTQRFGREPTIDELSVELKITKKTIERLQIIQSQKLLSLDDLNGNEEIDFYELTDDDNPHGVVEEIANDLLREEIARVLDTLPERDATILKLRYGFIDGEDYTLEKIGQVMGVTKERIRQIKAKALNLLRDPSILRKLQDYR